MHRRRFVFTAAVGVLAAPRAAMAQQAAKVYRISVLITGGREQENVIRTDLRGRLDERGWVEDERLPALAAELVRLEPDLIIARGGPSATAAKRATATIPIVIYGAIDPVSIGLVDDRTHAAGKWRYTRRHGSVREGGRPVSGGRFEPRLSAR